MRSTLLLAISALLSRLLGVFRDHLLARTFGASAGVGIYNLDVYYAAFRIPDLIYNLLIFGAISAAFIPLFTQHKKEGQMQEAWKFASSLMTILFLGTAVFSAVFFVLAPWITPMIAGGFDAEATTLTTRLLRILLLSPILMCISAIFISIQDSFKHFFWRSLAPLFYNAGIIFGIWMWGAKFGVVGVTWGVILGAGLQLLVQIPAMLKVGFKFWPSLGTGRADVHKAFRLMGPRVLGLSMTQLTLLLNTLIASFVGTGAITIFYLADNLQALPLGMIGIAFAITSFATLSELASEPTTEKFAHEIRRVMGKILFWILPATVGLFLLREPVISVILEYGKFTAEDARMTAGVLAILLGSLVFQALIPTLVRGFYAYHDARTPLMAGFWGALISVALSFILGWRLGYGIYGIAAGVTLGNIVNFGWLAIKMRRKIGHSIFGGIGKEIFATAVMGGVIYWGMQKIAFPEMFVERAVYLGGVAMIGTGIYLGLTWKSFRSA